MTDLERISLTLHDIGAVKLGQFTLHSGKTSPIYIDLRVLVSHPTALKLVAQAYAQRLRQLEFDILGAYPYAGLPLGVAVSLEMDIPLVYPRKEMKKYGTGKQVEGVWQIGQKVALIEDLVTSGKSIVEAAAVLKTAGMLIEDAVVLIDRQAGGSQDLADQGITVHSIITLSQVLAFLERHGRVRGTERAKILKALSIA